MYWINRVDYSQTYVEEFEVANADTLEEAEAMTKELAEEYALTGTSGAMEVRDPGGRLCHIVEWTPEEIVRTN